MLPQRGIPPKMPPGGGPSRLSSAMAGRPGFGQRPGLGPRRPGPVTGAQKKAPAPPKPPPSFFGQKQYFSKLDLRERTRKLSPFILQGKIFTKPEREKIVEQWFPNKRFGAYVNESEIKYRLRELRKQEYWAKPAEKKTIKSQRKLLEAFTGVRKY